MPLPLLPGQVVTWPSGDLDCLVPLSSSPTELGEAGFRKGCLSLGLRLLRPQLGPWGPLQHHLSTGRSFHVQGLAVGILVGCNGSSSALLHLGASLGALWEEEAPFSLGGQESQ